MKLMLEDLRKDIDIIDYLIIQLLDLRFDIAQKTKVCKSTISDSDREKDVINNVLSIKTKHLRKDFLKKLYIEIVNESKTIQKSK